MCRSIRPLFNFEPPATTEEIQAASLQFVRKVSGSTRPSQANTRAFDLAVAEITDSVTRLLEGLSTTAAVKNREVEMQKARARAQR